MKTFVSISLLIASLMLGGCATQEDSNLQRIRNAVAEQNAQLALYDTPRVNRK